MSGASSTRSFTLSPAVRTLFQRYSKLLDEGISPISSSSSSPSSMASSCSGEITDEEIASRFWQIHDAVAALQNANMNYRFALQQQTLIQPLILSHPFYPLLVNSAVSTDANATRQLYSSLLASSLLSKPIATRKLLHVGCGFGVDLRQLIVDGYNLSNLFGMDSKKQLIDVSFDLLFKDRDSRKVGIRRRLKQVNLLPEVVPASSPVAPPSSTSEPSDSRSATSTPLPCGSSSSGPIRHPEEKCRELKQLMSDKDGSGGIDAVYTGHVYHLLTQGQTQQMNDILFHLVRANNGVLFGQFIGYEDELADDTSATSTSSSSASSPSSNVEQNGVIVKVVDMNTTVESQKKAVKRFLHTAASFQKQLEASGFCNVVLEKQMLDYSRDSHFNFRFYKPQVYSYLDIPGAYYIPNFVTPEEETKIVSMIDSFAWSTAIHRRQQFYGEMYYHTSHDLPSIQPGDASSAEATSSLVHPLESFDWLIERLVAADRQHGWGVFKDDESNAVTQVLVNEYRDNQGISSHFDDFEAFGDYILTVSLLMPIQWTMKKPQHINNHCEHIEKRRKILLEPCSLLVTARDSRYAWRHGITKAKHVLDEKRAHEDDDVVVFRDHTYRRISLTIRKLLEGRKKVKSQTSDYTSRINKCPEDSNGGGQSGQVEDDDEEEDNRGDEIKPTIYSFTALKP